MSCRDFPSFSEHQKLVARVVALEKALANMNSFRSAQDTIRNLREEERTLCDEIDEFLQLWQQV